MILSRTLLLYLYTKDGGISNKENRQRLWHALLSHQEVLHYRQGSCTPNATDKAIEEKPKFNEKIKICFHLGEYIGQEANLAIYKFVIFSAERLPAPTSRLSGWAKGKSIRSMTPKIQ